MIKSKKNAKDYEVAYQLHREINCFGVTENAILTEGKTKDNYQPRTLIDQTLELIDPTPNIYTLFVQFNTRFFWNVLLPVEVKWSNRMTSCAGTCTFHPRNRQCVITLSAPLLKLRPRKDLVETLLHEMIHGYLFLTNNNRDRDGHGPEFCKHMNRINNSAGTKITIYHSFHDEVKLYKQHWWRCNGPCQSRAPYFGTVRRAMNRAPGPSDFWWKDHQLSCNGQFIKIKEPENFKGKNSKIKEKSKTLLKDDSTGKNISNWLIKSPPSVSTLPSTSTPKHIKSTQNIQNSGNGFKKLGNAVNNVFGWGIAGPNGSSKQTSSTPASNTPHRFSTSKTLGGSHSGKSNLLNKFDTVFKQKSPKNINIKSSKSIMESWNNGTKIKGSSNNDESLNKPNLVECPICSSFVSANSINHHVDSCLNLTNERKDSQKSRSEDIMDSNSTKPTMLASNSTSAQKRKIFTDNILSNKQQKLDNLDKSKMADCPICRRTFRFTDINEHVDICLTGANSTVGLNDSNANDSKNGSIISLSSTSSSDSDSLMISSKKDSRAVFDLQKNSVVEHKGHKCLVCDMFITPEMSLNDHLEDCVGSVFNDDSTLSDCDNEKSSEVTVIENNKHPCPVCMELILESLMNQHLDVCLTNSK